MSALTVPLRNVDHVLGPATAPVTLVEYGDFECPHCAAAYPIVEEIRQRLAGNLCFVYRHFPLTTIHFHAQNAAEASEAAEAQDHFWNMHRVLFQHQDALENSDLVAYATQLELDGGRFIEALSSHRYAARVRDDVLSGARSGVNATPTFFVNGARHEGSIELSSLSASIVTALQVFADRR